jgi:uncharacterized protein YndB with AHSA1/START domain
VLTVESERALALEWQVADKPTRVTFRLHAHGPLTRVVVEHDVGDDPSVLDAVRDTMGTDLGHLDHAWGYALLMLKTFVETGTANARFASGGDPLKAELVMALAAPPARVFAALVEPQQLKQWAFAGAKPEVEARKGGRYSFGWGSEQKGTDGPDEIVEFVDGKKITYSWHQGYYGDPKTLVSWSVEPAEGGQGSRVRLQHSGFIRDPKRVLEYKLGWTGFLYSLADHFAQRDFNAWQGQGEGPA